MDGLQFGFLSFVWKTQGCYTFPENQKYRELSKQSQNAGPIAGQSKLRA